MKLSDKMPAQMDSKLPAQMPATMPSQATATGGGGSLTAPAVPSSQSSSGGVEEDAIDRKGEAWQTANFGKTGWETQDKSTSDTDD